MAYIYVPSSARCRFSDYPLPPATPQARTCSQARPAPADHRRLSSLYRPFRNHRRRFIVSAVGGFSPLYDFIGKSDENTAKSSHFTAYERNKIIFFCRSSYFAASFARLSSPPNEILTSTGPFCLLSVSVHFTPSPMSCFSAKIARLVS